jgi:hypothetical protein
MTIRRDKEYLLGEMVLNTMDSLVKIRLMVLGLWNTLMGENIRVSIRMV